METPLLVHGGRVWSGAQKTPQNPFVEAFLVERGLFSAVGPLERVASLPGARKAEKVDLAGALAIPGMTDAHIHLTAYCKQGLYLDLSGARSLAEMLARVREQARRSKHRWLRAVNYNETLWSEPVAPTMEMLGDAAEGKAVLVSRYCGHVHVANARVLHEAGLWDSSDENVRRGPSGEPTGVLKEGAADAILRAVAAEQETPGAVRKLLFEGCQALAACGITAVHACDAPSYGLPEDLSTLQDFHTAGELSLRVISYHDRLPDFDFKSGYGNDFLRYGGLKIFLDGALGGRSAALRADYADAPGERGRLNHDDEELYALLEQAQRRDIQVQLHMIGDAATDQAIRVARDVRGNLGVPPKLPLRFNHVVVSPPDQLEPMKGLGVVLDVQPIQAVTDRDMAPARLGPDRMRHVYSFRRLHDSGLLMTGSSDAPIENPNPWLGIWAAVDRPEEALTLDEALALYTRNPYRAIGWSDRYGTIEEGKSADFTILECDPFACAPHDLRAVRVRRTYVEGVRTF